MYVCKADPYTHRFICGYTTVLRCCFGVVAGAGSFAALVLSVCILYHCCCKPKEEDDEQINDKCKRKKTQNSEKQHSSADTVSMTSVSTISQPSSPQTLKYVNVEKRPKNPEVKQEGVSIARRW